MKGKVKLKIFTFFLLVAGLKCDFLDEVKELLDKLQSTVDKISLEQIKTNKKVDQLEEKNRNAWDNSNNCGRLEWS